MIDLKSNQIRIDSAIILDYCSIVDGSLIVK